MRTNYTYRFWYKIGFYSLLIPVFLLSGISIYQTYLMRELQDKLVYAEDDAKCYRVENLELKYEVSFISDVYTAQDYGMCEMFCARLAEHRSKRYRQAINDNDNE